MNRHATPGTSAEGLNAPLSKIADDQFCHSMDFFSLIFPCCVDGYHWYFRVAAPTWMIETEMFPVLPVIEKNYWKFLCKSMIIYPIVFCVYNFCVILWNYTKNIWNISFLLMPRASNRYTKETDCGGLMPEHHMRCWANINPTLWWSNRPGKFPEDSSNFKSEQ